ncbi:MAG: ParB/RepB/Spo0J family partition protein [bacterium]|nr:ParB/RepB/Spo0J family partition protein [bacterium]
MSKQRLGKGLGALITDMNQEEQVQSILLDIIMPNPYQPRRDFSVDQLEQLAESIMAYGVIQPITVRRRGEIYELVVGERRLRAAKMAGLSEIPALVKDMADSQLMEISIVENLQREDLNPIEEAGAYQQLLFSLGYTQDKLAERIGKSRSYVANTLRLLTLPSAVSELVSRGTLSAGHARAVLSAPEQRREEMAVRMVAEDMTVRQAEHLVQTLTNVSRETKQKQARNKKVLSVVLADVERRFREALQSKVTILPRGAGGKIEIEFYSEEELERLLEIVERR